MIKILAALALTMGAPVILIALSLLVSRIGFVERLFDLDGDHDFFYRFCAGFSILLLCVLALILLADLFLAVYGLL